MATEKLYKVYRYWIYLDPDPKPWSYIGNTKDSLTVRAGGLTGSDYFTCKRFWGAIEAYGFPAFEREILEDNLTQEEAWEKEQYYIQKFNSIDHGWNTSTGGKSGTLGTHVNKGKVRPEELNKAHSLRMTGEGNSFYRKHHSEEQRKKWSKERKGIPNSHKKPIIQYTRDGEFIAEFSSITEASKALGINPGNIQGCCSGAWKQVKGFTFRYKDTN